MFDGLREELTQQLIPHLYGDDEKWLEGGRLKGLPEKAYTPRPARDLNHQRGWRFM